MEQVKFGLFDWIDRGKKPLQKLYEERLRLLEGADSAGFLGYHLAEHHFTPLGMAPSPALFLSAAAQRTPGTLGILVAPVQSSAADRRNLHAGPTVQWPPGFRVRPGNLSL